ncbi:cytochrome-c peroxidase [Duganella callida]|uniref:C-type cytochrome n=1 Tax=Duganella callida TaxID=2561932 RepID=A0A4Y9S2F4_9BURK|nr:cytochrome c peroxidase [Duganella callida]TFW15659.1 c-type cytochrome [Duganella callida]
MNKRFAAIAPHCGALLLALTLVACERAPAPAAASPTAADRAAVAALGRKIFFDATLSGSGRLSCASCHNPAHAYGPPDGKAVQLGGEHLDREGMRAVPSLRYVLPRTPRWFKEHQRDPIEREIEVDSVPTGGFTRDGRFDTLHDQARAPLFDPVEMANRDDASLAARLRATAYAAEFARVFGAAALADDRKAVNGLAMALERFQLDDPSFAPYTSKFDRALKGQARLSAREQRGLRLFADPDKGNCASCHIAAPGANGAPPLFTDYSFANLGVPRNRKLAANADPAFHDIGLCGPLRKMPAALDDKYCGTFKTPSLRNVASRQVFMHNGVFDNLADAVRFYVERDIRPARWYGKSASGKIERYNDLPAAYRSNVDHLTAPMNRKPGDKPALDEAEIQDIVAFLRTLTDDDVQS